MQTLEQWLAYIETAHPQNIDMGLTRIRQVYERLAIDLSGSTVITVAGTNGKGTTCRFIEQACLEAGFSVGVYSSPHILHFNERIRLNGQDVSDEIICAAFERINIAATNNNHSISLSYFEYASLCSMLIFAQSELDVCIFEVGLGGRLDATNIVDADIGVITSIGLDHQSYLGNTTELIAGEKAGIIKPKQHVVIGYTEVHKVVKNIINDNACEALFCGIDFGFEWIIVDGQEYKVDLSQAKIPPQNVMTAIATLSYLCTLKNKQHVIASNKARPLLLPIKDLQGLIDKISMPGRFEVISETPHIILDVAHNQDSAEYLVNKLKQLTYVQCHIVIGMLKDKNIEATIDCLSVLNGTWYCVDLPGERGEKGARLKNAVISHNQTANVFKNLQLGLQQAVRNVGTNDIILVVGSFVLAAECMNALEEIQKG